MLYNDHLKFSHHTDMVIHYRNIHAARRPHTIYTTRMSRRTKSKLFMLVGVFHVVVANRMDIVIGEHFALDMENALKVLDHLIIEAHKYCINRIGLCANSHEY